MTARDRGETSDAHARTHPPPIRRPPSGCSHIYYFGDVRVGTIAERVGNPHDTDPWEWNCGSYPGSEPGEISSETAATLEQARADFERAWQVVFFERTEADFR